MMLTEGISIRRDDTRHKFSCAMAEFLYCRLDMSDQYAGSDECPHGWFERFGKRVLRGNDQGFVWLEQYPSADDAEQAVDAWQTACSTWEQGPYDDDGNALDPIHMSRVESWAEYVDHCSREGLTAHDFDMWRVHGCPRGPIDTTTGEAL